MTWDELEPEPKQHYSTEEIKRQICDVRQHYKTLNRSSSLADLRTAKISFKKGHRRCRSEALKKNGDKDININAALMSLSPGRVFTASNRAKILREIIQGGSGEITLFSFGDGGYPVGDGVLIF